MKSILTGICAFTALLAGFFAALVAMIGIAVFMIPRLIARRRPGVPPAPPPPSPRRTGWVRRPDAIDVTATEVRDP